MNHLVRLGDLTRADVQNIFDTADRLTRQNCSKALGGRAVVTFFPASSLRTRVTFEKGIHLLGGQPILFPSDTLDKKEDIRDVCAYLSNWADALVVRHRDIALVERMAQCSSVPVINAMTDCNHPCEILTDLYSLRRMGRDISGESYLFVGKKGNIGSSWKAAADLLGFSLEQCCGRGYELEGVKAHYDIHEAIKGKDIICTDSLPASALGDFEKCRVTAAALELANTGALLNPCPPFFRGEEVSADAVASEHFVGYGFKKHLLEVQQAILLWCLGVEL